MPLTPEPGLSLLQLLHLADSALPIGGMAHSFGLETLAAEEILMPEGLEEFLRDYLAESGMVEATYCRAAYQLAAPPARDLNCERWLEINCRLSALRLARESRIGSITLGENFLRLVLRFGEFLLLQQAAEAAKQSGIHHAPAFGLTGAVLSLGEESVAQAFLHHLIAGLISACQRLMPLGQTAAGKILWNLKPAIAEAARESRSETIESVACFTPLPDWGGFAHPGLTTRLFIS